MTSRPSRRTALASLPAVAAASTAAAPAAPVGPASGRPHPAETSSTGPLRLAFVADTHTDPENEDTLAKMHAVFAAVEQFDPDLVIHGGDVTEHGTAAEYDAFDAAVPDALRDRIAAVPGNHETRWDPTAGQRRHERIGEDVRVRDVGGVRIILADTTAHQQEVAWWSQQALADLDDAMADAKSMPRILVTHFPMGEGYYYVANQQEFEDVLSRHPIPLHLTGHTHRELLTRVNRRDQLEAAAVKIDAAYYELTGTIEDLAVTRVEIPDLSDPTQTVRTPVTSYDLRPEHGRDRWMPRHVEPVDEGASLAVEVTLPGAFTGGVDAALYDTSVYAGRNEELTWTELSGGGGRYSGSLDATEVAPGSNRVHLRVRPEDGSGNRLLTVPYTRSGGGTVWESSLGGMIQGGLARVRSGDEELLVAASSTGQVRGIDRSGATRWTHRVDGEVRHDLVALEDGAAVAVPDTAGFLQVLEADGSPRWRYATGAPIAADPGTGLLDDLEVVFVCSGAILHAIEVASGEALWTVELPAPAMGAPTSDGRNVYLGAGDGCAHALDGGTGKSLWVTSLTDRTGSYQRFIYGPWNDAVTVMPGDGVIVSGIADTWCLESHDGSTRWREEGSFQYARDVATEEGGLILADEGGEIVTMTPADGAVKARYPTAERILDEGFVLVDDVAYAASHSGLLTAVGIMTGDIEPITRLSTAPVLAPGAVFGDLIVFGDLAGTVHAVERV